MKSLNQSAVGKFLIHDSTKILNRGFFLIGELTVGKIESGNIMLLNFSRFTENATVEQIEGVRKLKNEIAENLIAVKISIEIPEKHINQIRNNHKGIIAMIYEK